MKKKIFLSTVAATIIGAGTLTYHHASQPTVELTPTMIENIEALTDGENGDYTSLHWEVRIISIKDLSYSCRDGGTTVCPFIWPY